MIFSLSLLPVRCDNKVVILLIFINIIAVCSSCNIFSTRFFTQALKSKNFNNRIDTLSNDLAESIRTDGYYEAEFMDSIMYNTHYETRFKWDTVRFYYIFYKDGTVAQDIFPMHFVNGKLKTQERRRGNIEKYLVNVNKDKRFEQSYFNGLWGIAKLIGDTIRLQAQYNSPLKQNINAMESFWRIDGNELIGLGGRALGPNKTYKIRWKSPSDITKLRFIQFDNIPPSNKSWIRKQKWAWYK